MPFVNEARGQCVRAAEDDLVSLSWPVPFRLLDVQKQGEMGISPGSIDPSLAMIVAVEMRIVEMQRHPGMRSARESAIQRQVEHDVQKAVVFGKVVVGHGYEQQAGMP